MIGRITDLIESEDRITDLIESEIRFYQESSPPVRYRFLCWLCRIRPRNEVIVDELLFVLDYICKARLAADLERARKLEEYKGIFEDWERAAAKDLLNREEGEEQGGNIADASKIESPLSQFRDWKRWD